MAEESEIKVFSGKEAVFSVLTEIVETRKGERLYIYQGKDGPSSWIEFLGLEKVVAINKKLTENGLIAISVRSHKTKDEVSSRPKLHESYAERIMKTHPILDHFFEEKTSMYVSRGICIFVNLKTGFAFKIEDRLFSSTLIKMFELISESLKR